MEIRDANDLKQMYFQKLGSIIAYDDNNAITLSHVFDEIMCHIFDEISNLRTQIDLYDWFKELRDENIIYLQQMLEIKGFTFINGTIIDLMR